MSHDKCNTRPLNIAAAEKQRLALEMRKRGMSFKDIAEELGYSHHSGAQRAVETALKKIIQEPAQELIKLELERLNEMVKALWLKVEAGEEKAIETGLRVMERRARYLGLDTPAKIALTDPDGKHSILPDAETIKAIAEMFRPGNVPGDSESETSADS